MNRVDADAKELNEKKPVPDIGLARASVILSLLIELPCGIEGGLIYGPLWDKSLFQIIAAKVAFLTIIGMPLVIYAVRNGVNALGFVRGHISIVAIVACISLTHNSVMLWRR